jgi:GcrA cell cycle regulator
MPDTFEWTPARVQSLREAWAAGFSAAVIAHALGVGRGSIIGKARRLGLARRATGKRPRQVAAAPRPAKRAPVRSKPAALRPKPAPAGNRIISLAHVPAKPARRLDPVRRRDQAPNNNSPAIPLVRSSRRMPPIAADAAGAKMPGRAVPAVAGAAPPPRTQTACGLLELTNETCRWPYEPAGLGDPRYCGEPGADLSARAPYCAAHMRLAYVVAPRPRRKGRAR